jgi:hypothetical protein
LEQPGDLGFAFAHGTASDVGASARPHAVRSCWSDGKRRKGPERAERLDIGVKDQEIDAPQPAVRHPAYGIASTTTYAHHPDADTWRRCGVIAGVYIPASVKPSIEHLQSSSSMNSKDQAAFGSARKW